MSNTLSRDLTLKGNSMVYSEYKVLVHQTSYCSISFVETIFPVVFFNYQIKYCSIET